MSSIITVSILGVVSAWIASLENGISAGVKIAD
jgi:hypothetical protein